MRNCLPILFLVALVCCTDAADRPPITVTDAGYFVTVVGSDGVPKFAPVDIVDLRTGTGDTPTTPDTPTPPDGIAADAARWSAAIDDPAGAMKFALIFEVARDAVSDGLIGFNEVDDVLRDAADSLIPATWADFRRKLSDHLTTMAQEGRTGDIRNELERIRYGVGYSARGNPSLEMSEAARVVATTNLIVENHKNGR